MKHRGRYGARLAAAWLLILASAFPASAQVRVGVQGYAKNLGIRATSFFTEEPYFLDLARLRTKGVLDAGVRLRAEAWLDSEVLLGDFLETPDYALAQTFDRPTFADLSWTVADGDRYAVRQQLFRAFANVYLGDVLLTLGRQRVAWGTGFVWNPTDLLNPVNPTAIERDEKEGTDAVYVSVPLGALSRFEAVAAPGRERDQTSVAVRAGAHIGEYDVSGMGGYFRTAWVLGGDFAGYVRNAGLRGEAALTLPDDGRPSALC